MRDISELVRYEDIHGHSGHYLTFKPSCWDFNVSTCSIKTDYWKRKDKLMK
jgi:hypothetical protein